MSNTIASKNKRSERLTADKINPPIRKENQNSARPKRNIFYRFNKIKNNIIKSNWVRMLHDREPSYAYIEVAAAELYRALGPINGALKTRLEMDIEDNPVAVLSKFDKDFASSTNHDAQRLSKHKQHLAECFAMLYLNEGMDVNTGNLDIKRGVRLDFEYDFIGFTKLYQGREVSSSFNNNRYISGNLFNIHPLDLYLFPNLLIAKPQHVLGINRFDLDHNKILHNLNASPEFTKTVYQYFLKALLFDKKMIKDIVGLHITDEELKNNFSTYIEARFKKLKLALVQVPAFRSCVNKLKENIVKEFNAYNATFKQPIVDIEQIKNKLTDLSLMFKECDLVDDNQNANSKFTKAFNLKFDNKNTFHQYAMRTLLASGDEKFSIENLLSVIADQAGSLKLHLNSMRDFPCENACLVELNEEILKHKSEENNWKKAEVLFNVDQKITEKLKQKEIKWYEANKNIAIALNNLSYIWGLNKTRNKIIRPVPEYSKIYALLHECITYAKDIKMRGDDLCATAYLEKTYKLLRIFSDGIDRDRAPQFISYQLIHEINKPDEFLLEHKSTFEELIRALLNFFNLPEVTLSWGKVAAPWFATERQKKLSHVVNAVRELHLNPLNIRP